MSRLSRIKRISRSASLLVLDICIVSVFHIISLSTQGWHDGHESIGLFPAGDIPEWWKLAQASMVLGLICLMFSEVCAIVSLLSKQKHYPNDKRFIAGCLLIGFIFTTGSWITFAVEMSKDDNRLLLGLSPEEESSFNYSFGLAVVSSILTLLLIVQALTVRKGEYEDAYQEGTQGVEDIYDNITVRKDNVKEPQLRTKLSTSSISLSPEEQEENDVLGQLPENFTGNPAYRNNTDSDMPDYSRWSASEFYSYQRQDGIFKSLSNQEFKKF